MCVGVDAIVTENASTSESLRMNVIMNALNVTASGLSDYVHTSATITTVRARLVRVCSCECK